MLLLMASRQCVCLARHLWMLSGKNVQNCIYFLALWLYESYFNVHSRPAIQEKKKNILLEFYKQEFKQGCFMLLLLTFYNEEATYWSSEVKLNFCFLTNV